MKRLILLIGLLFVTLLNYAQLSIHKNVVEIEDSLILGDTAGIYGNIEIDKLITDTLQIGDSVVTAIHAGTLVDTKFVNEKFALFPAITNPTDSIVFNGDIPAQVANDFKIYGDTLTGLLAYFRENATGQDYINATANVPFVNTTGITLYPGTPLSSKTLDVSKGRGLPSINIANCIDFNLAASFAGVSRDTISTGEVGTLLIRNFLTYNTSLWSLEDNVWVGCDSTLTNVKPNSPYYPLFVGKVISVGTSGIIAVNAQPYIGNDTEVAIDGMFNGIILEKQSISDTIISNVLYFETNNELRDTMNLPYMYQKVIYSLNTTTNTGTDGKARIALSYGTQSNPQVNYIYIDHNGGSPQLAVNTTAFPTDGIRLAECSVYDQTTHETYGFAHFQRWNNSVDGSTTDGWVTKSAKNARLAGTRWYSGIDQTVTLVTNAAGLDSLNIYTAAGVVPQFNFQNFDAQSEKKYYWFNAPGGGKWIDDLHDVDSTADGTSVRSNNSRYDISIFGVQNSGSFPDYLLVAVSSEDYATDDGAIGGANAISSVPTNLRYTAFRIARIPVRYNTADNGTLTNLLGTGQFIDDRGQPLGIGAGASSGTGATYPVSDATISINNNADPTKIMDFDISAVPTGTTNTLKMADRDVDLDTIVGFGDALDTELLYRDGNKVNGVGVVSATTIDFDKIIRSDDYRGYNLNNNWNNANPSYSFRNSTNSGMRIAGVGQGVALVSGGDSTLVATGDSVWVDPTLSLTGAFEDLVGIGTYVEGSSVGKDSTWAILYTGTNKPTFTQKDSFDVVKAIPGSASGGGEVDTAGTPVANELAYFTAANKIGSMSGVSWDGTSLSKTNSTSSAFMDITNSSTGRGGLLLNTGLGEGFYISNSGGGTGLQIANVNGGGMVLTNTTSVYGMSVSNSSSGEGISVSNTQSGIGVNVTNTDSDGTGLKITNSSQAAWYGLHVDNTVSATGIQVDNGGGYNGIYIDNDGTGRGLVIQNESTNAAFIIEDASNNSQVEVDVNGDLYTYEVFIQDTEEISAADATPDVSTGNIFVHNSTTSSTTITDLDNPVVGAIYRIIGNSDTYTITINDSGNFNLSGNWVGGADDVITLYVQADNDYIEISRTDN
jgi:hypothetical protein